MKPLYNNLIQNEHFVITRSDNKLFPTDPKASSKQIAAIKADGFTKQFGMYDDDAGAAYYHGYAKEEEFYPLDDYGMPNAGCTEIRYRQPNGEYKTL